MDSPHLVSHLPYPRVKPSRLLQYLRNRVFLAGLAGLAAVGLVAYFVFDSLVMPVVTRHGDAVPVPDVMSLQSEEAARALDEAGLVAQFQTLRRPNLPRDIVIDQRPAAGSAVKPGRHVFLTVNTGDTTTVTVPRVLGLSLREAQSRMVLLGLVVPTVLPDSIPSSHANTVTRQEPEAGTRVPAGMEVTLWFSTGLGERYVTVPDVTGIAPDEARARLLELRLRSVVLGETENPDAPLILDQSPQAGAQVREGFEIRLRVGPTAPEQPPSGEQEP